jgi:hypothetical protein
MKLREDRQMENEDDGTQTRLSFNERYGFDDRYEFRGYGFDDRYDFVTGYARLTRPNQCC